MTKIRAVVLILWLAGSGLLLASARAAEIATLPLIDLQHTAWTARDGAPADIHNLTQTDDGWLWLGASDGLYRFDGVKFERYQPRAGKFLPLGILNLGRLADGRLWLSSNGLGLSILQGDVLRSYSDADGLPRATIYKVLVDGDGRLWATSAVGIHTLEAGASRWRHDNASLGLPPDRFLALDALLDRQGTFWLLTPEGIYARRKGEVRFARVAEQHGGGVLLEAADGRVWAGDSSHDGLQLLFSPPGLHTPVPETSIATGGNFIFDRAGNLWAAAGTGLRMSRFSTGKVQTRQFGVQHGLSDERVRELFQDREGNIWVATTGGLDQFRPKRLQAMELPSVTTFAMPVLAGADGDAWIDQFYLPRLDARLVPLGPGSTDFTMVTVLYRDPHGQLWMGARDGLWQIKDGQRVQLPNPADLRRSRYTVILSMQMDAQDGLWVSFAGNGVYRWHQGAWTRLGGVPELNKQVINTIRADATGRLWFGNFENQLLVLDGGKVRIYSGNDGLAIGSIEEIIPYGQGALLAGEGGLAWFDGRAFSVLAGMDEEKFAGVKGMLLTPDGQLWLNGAHGLLGIGKQELARALRQPGYPMHFKRFDFNDGLRGVSPQSASVPTLTRLSTGELLFATAGGVFRLDPARYQTNRLAPTVQITSVWFNNAGHAAQPSLQLPPSPDTVRIDYTALSLTQPQRVRFRYLLEGVDRDWQDAGARRSAYYTTLAPCSYRFRVVAANEDGVWNEQGAGMTLVVSPTLVQTWWFKLLCVVALALLAWLLYRLRLRVALRRMQRQFDQRVAERERIARDLHDTLLQSVQGLILAFRRIALRTPEDTPTRPMMDQALALALDVMAEGRDKVGDLRQGGDHRDLAQLLSWHGQRRGEHEAAAFALRVEGEVRPLHAAVLEESFAIGREAINNAYLHAQARHIEVVLSYGERYFELTVRDDGKGLPAGTEPSEPGHWGVAGMRERAGQIGAVLTLITALGEGASWSLRMPARIAYAGTGARALTPDAAHGQPDQERDHADA